MKYTRIFTRHLRPASKNSNRTRSAIIIVSTVLIGVVLLIATHAATPTASVEVEQGSGLVTRLSGGGASANGYVRFTSPSTSNSGYWDPMTNRPFAASSLFNTPTPASTAWFSQQILNTPVSSEGSDYLAYGGVRGWQLQGFNVSQPIWSAKDTDPVWTLHLTSPRDDFRSRVRPDITLQVKAPADMHSNNDSLNPSADIDHVLLLISGGKYYEVYQGVVNQSTRTVTQSYYGYAIGDIRNDVGYSTAIANGLVNMGTRATNMSWIAGMITGRDLANNKIDHAIAVALSKTTLNGGGCGLHLAWNKDIATYGDDGGDCGPIAAGAKLGIPAGVAKPSGLSKFGGMLFDALQTYGAYVGDHASSTWPIFYADPNTVNDANLGWSWPNQQSDNSKIVPLLKVAKSSTGE